MHRSRINNTAIARGKLEQLYFDGPRDLNWREAPDPQLLSPHDALVRPVAIAVCDADVAAITGKAYREPGRPFGHEFVAEVVDVGSEVKFVAGSLVVVSFKIACGECARCLEGFSAACVSVKLLSAYGFDSAFGDWGGAMSDLVRVPYANHMMFSLPDHVDAATASSAGDNLADAYRCVAPGLEHYPGKPVLIVAGGGGAPSISLYAVAIAVALGSERVDYMDRHTDRLRIAETLGANAIEVAAPPDLVDDYLVTADTSAHPSGEWLRYAIRSTSPYGLCTSCGAYRGDIAVPMGDMYMRGIRFTIGWVNTLTQTPKVLELLSSKKLTLEPIHTICPWSDAVEAMTNPSHKTVVVRD